MFYGTLRAHSLTAPTSACLRSQAGERGGSAGDTSPTQRLPHPVRSPWGLAEAAELTPQVHTWEGGLQGRVFWFFFEGWVRKRQGGFSWQGSRSSLATRAVGPPPQVSQPSCGGRALVLQPVGREGDAGGSLLLKCFAISDTGSVTSVTSCFILNTFACRQQFCSLSYIAIETIFCIPLFVVHFC